MRQPHLFFLDNLNYANYNKFTRYINSKFMNIKKWIYMKGETRVKKTKRLTLRRIGSIWLFVIPALIPMIVFWIYPILRSVYISFTDWDFMTPTYNFVFLDNFKAILQDSRFYDALWNTVVFTIGTLLPTIGFGLMLALLLQKSFKGSGIIKFIIFSPWITPTVAVSIVWTWIYDADSGIANGAD